MKRGKGEEGPRKGITVPTEGYNEAEDVGLLTGTWDTEWDGYYIIAVLVHGQQGNTMYMLVTGV